MQSKSDIIFMHKALDLAKKAASMGEVPVGAVIVQNGVLIAEGFNLRETNNTALGHAEIAAIDAACKALGRWRLDDCTIYVTLEPCPMCAGAIINARIRRVVYGAMDPKAGCAGSVSNLFAMDFSHRPTLTLGVLEDECIEILTDFFRELR